MKLYCIGVGPGNPEMLTKEAFEILNKADIIFSGVSAQSGYKIAENTIFDLIRDKKIIYFEYARLRRVGIEEYWKVTTDMIIKEMQNSETSVMITVGDPTVFSSFMIVRDMLESKGIETEIINGVSSITAVGKALNIPILMKDETLIVTTGAHPHRTGQYKKLLATGSTVMFLKGQRGLKKLVYDDTEIANLQAAFVRNASMSNEEVHRGTLKDIFDHFDWKRATIVVKKEWQKN